MGGYTIERTVKETTCLCKLGEYPTVLITHNYKNSTKMQDSILASFFFFSFVFLRELRGSKLRLREHLSDPKTIV